VTLSSAIFRFHVDSLERSFFQKNHSSVLFGRVLRTRFSFFMRNLSELLIEFNQYLAKNPFQKTPVGLYEPCDYILGLGGKRIRPAMLLMGFELFDDRFSRSMPAAMAVEVFHNFSLIHDDIMDAAPLRRGRETVHHRWNLNTGILSGDVMLVVAYEFLGKIRDQKSGWKCMQIMNRVARGVCEGQQMDMDFEQRADVALDEYLKMIELKTAVLLAGALKMGGIIGGASTSDAEHLYEIGRLAGIAFQIQDDLLDSFGDPEKFGKQVGGDILQNKKTFLVIKFLEIADQNDQKTLLDWMNKPTTAENAAEKVAAVKYLFQKNGIIELTETAKRTFSEAAFRHLDAISVDTNKKLVLKNTLEELIGRDN
jgi:geranylgeranyl diphosphate synthase, type II